MCVVFVIKTRHRSVSRGNRKITRKEMSKSFLCDYFTICWNVAIWDAREERNLEEYRGFWLLWGIFNEYIKQHVVMAVFRKANFDSVDISNFMIFWQTFFRCKGNFVWLWLLLPCFNMVGGLESLFRTCYHIFPRVTVPFTTQLTKILIEFCTVFNTLPLSAHYQMCYCMPYQIFPVK